MTKMIVINGTRYRDEEARDLGIHPEVVAERAAALAAEQEAAEAAIAEKAAADEAAFEARVAEAAEALVKERDEAAAKARTEAETVKAAPVKAKEPANKAAAPDNK
jgi:hypothetical protein